MTKKITNNQILGELGETAVKKLVLEMGMIYEHRGLLEAGIDGLIEFRDPSTHAPLGKLLGVQVNSTDAGQYLGESADWFEYLLRPEDLAYWRQSNIPVIIVLWSAVTAAFGRLVLVGRSVCFGKPLLVH